jgi:hypothetical protein
MKTGLTGETSSSSWDKSFGVVDTPMFICLYPSIPVERRKSLSNRLIIVLTMVLKLASSQFGYAAGHEPRRARAALALPLD